MLPNTFYIKGDSFNIENIKLGIIYIAQFLALYGIVQVTVLTAFSKKKISMNDVKSMRSSGSFFLLGSILLPILYIIKVGGDFMEFRFFIPILPIFFILLVDFLSRYDRAILQTSLIALPVISIFNIAAPRYNGVEKISQLDGHIHNPNENWAGIGKRLSQIFPVDPEKVTIGVTPAGAIPFYSKLKTIDLLGLNDTHIARNGIKIGSRPGHTKGPSYEYISNSGVNLLIGHPQVRKRYQRFDKNSFLNSFKWFLGSDNFEKLISTKFLVLSMPIDDEYCVDVIYLNASNAVDEAIRDGELLIAMQN